jgi:hypothetical protein
MYAINGRYSTGTYPEGGRGIMGSTYFLLVIVEIRAYYYIYYY